MERNFSCTCKETMEREENFILIECYQLLVRLLYYEKHRSPHRFWPLGRLSLEPIFFITFHEDDISPFFLEHIVCILWIFMSFARKCQDKRLKIPAQPILVIISIFIQLVLII
jgi:hypothetical protein